MPPPKQEAPTGADLLDAVSLQQLDVIADLVRQVSPSDAERALSRAAGRGWMEGVEVLLPHADVEGRRSQPMLAAVAQGRLAVMARLWSHAQGGNPKRDSGLWADKAVERGQLEALRWLVAQVPITAQWAPALARAARDRLADPLALLATPALVAWTVPHLLAKTYSESAAVDQLTPYLTPAQMDVCLERLGRSHLPLLEARRQSLIRQRQLERRPPTPGSRGRTRV